MTPINIQDYDPRWRLHFETLRSRIAAALGPLAAAIEHIGSTAIPGLAAKPIIDLDVLLRSNADLEQVIKALESVGYKHRGNLGIPGRDAFQSPLADFPHHLYVCSPDGREYQRHLLFRDYLRAHPEQANAYEDLKRNLAAKYSDDREAYTQAKTEFVESVLRSV